MGLLKYILQDEMITEEKKEILSFGLQQIILTVIYWISVLTVGFFFQEALASIVFLIAFSILRMFSGGYHAKTIRGCYFISMLLLIAGFWTLHVDLWTSNTCIIITILSAAALFMVVPVDSENRRLDELEKRSFRKIALIILLVEIVVEILGILLNCPVVYEAIALGINMSGILAILGICKNIFSVRTKKENQSSGS